MYKLCTTEESAQRQQQMARSLLELMRSLPYSRITVAGICDRVGVSRKAFYSYFDCKEDCLFFLVDQAVLGFAEFYPRASRTVWPDLEYLEQYFTYWQKQQDLLEALNRNNFLSLIYERTLICIDEELPNLRTDPVVSDDFDQFLFMICGTTSLILNRHIGGYRKTAAQMAACVDRLIAKPERT